MDRGSKFGKEAAEDAWKATEANTLYKLHAAGVRVPTPVMFLEGVLFMQLVLGPDGQAAPRLIDSELSVEEANTAYHDMLTQLVRILSCDLIHGDLSPYNVLWAATGPTIIDFPQCVSASHSSHSENFFLRDARNILGHFAAIDPRLRSRASDPTEIWRAYVRRELSPDFLPSGRPYRPEPRPRMAEPSSPRQAPHRAPPAPPAGNAQHRNPPAPRKPFTPPGQSAGNQHRNPQPARNTFAGPKSHPAPGHSRGGPRRPDVIVLTRRSGKAADAATTDEPAAGLSRSNSSSSPRFSPSPRSDANQRSNPNPRPHSNSNPKPSPRFSPRPMFASNATPSATSNPEPDRSQNSGGSQNRLATGSADASSPTRRKRRRRRRAGPPGN
jgi:RIO kinase 1